MRDPRVHAALVALAEANVPADVQEMLIRGTPDGRVKPGALEKAVMAAFNITGGQAMSFVNTDRPRSDPDDLREALQAIIQWADAYPVEVFPVPDLQRARALLEAGGMTIDSVSAHAMRHCLQGVREIAVKALGDRFGDHVSGGPSNSVEEW